MPTLVSSTLQQNITRSIDESFGAIHINMNKWWNPMFRISLFSYVIASW